MVKKIINTCLLIAIFSGVSCGVSENEEKVQIAANILNEERFTELLVDFSLAESAANINIKGVPVIKLDSVYAFNPLEENNVRKSQYDSTLVFYAKNAKLYKKIYENVLERLTQIQLERAAKKDSTGK